MGQGTCIDLLAAWRLQGGNERNAGFPVVDIAIGPRVEFTSHGLQLTFAERNPAIRDGYVGLVQEGQQHHFTQSALKRLRGSGKGPGQYKDRENA